MIPKRIGEAFTTLEAAVAADPAVLRALDGHWRAGGFGPPVVVLEQSIETAAEALDNGLPAMSRSKNSVVELQRTLSESAGPILFAWCRASVARGQIRMASLLRDAAKVPRFGAEVPDVARARIVEGPLVDALACVPLLGTGDYLGLTENVEASARIEILIWEAGASALHSPELAKWVWESEVTFEAMIAQPAHGSLRGRVLAARCLEICAGGLNDQTDPQMIGRTLQILQPLLLHPEPLVSTHAARAFGLFAGQVEHLEGTLLDWLLGDSLVLRQRALTAFTSLPAGRLRVLGHQLKAVLDDPENEAWALPAAAAGTPYLFQQSRDLWNDLASRIMRGMGGAKAAHALARGLATLWPRGSHPEDVRGPLADLRELARRSRSDSVEEWRHWLGVISATDPVDGAERAPLDLELGLENLVHLAAQYDDEEADARAARFALGLERTFCEARQVVLEQGSLRHRAAGMNALEGCARSMALGLWRPQLATHPRGEQVEEPDLSGAWDVVARAPTEFLEIVKQHRAEFREAGDANEEAAAAETALEVIAVRLGGYALDAAGGESDLGPGRGPTAFDTCVWLSQLEGVADGSRQMSAELQDALSATFWRLVDTTRGTSLGAVDDVEWLGPFAAWWALVIDRPAMLRQLGTALPMIREGVLERCCELADATRAVVAQGAPDGQWGEEAEAALSELHAADTELAKSLTGLAASLRRFASAAGPKSELEAMCLDLVLSAERLQATLADPVKALHEASDGPLSSLPPAASDNGSRVANLIARAIRSRELGVLDVWFASLGPVTSSLLETAVSGAAARTPPPRPAKKKQKPESIEGYELVRPLGEGGIGKIWLVRKPGADRLFVLKTPKMDALAGASETERAGILASFVDEARALAALYHPNVLNIIDRGVVDDAPFMVLELLIGADLADYSAAKLLTLFELRQIVLDSCAGLSSLHGAGLVHRDVKPANIWLRLPLDSGERFDPQKHRDPAHTRPLSAVVIDFGMVRAMKVSAEVGGRFVAGTPGYIAPDQVLDPVDLDGRADVYGLAACIYNVTTGRTFFDEIGNARERIFAHMKREPLEDPSLLNGYPEGLIKLMRAATTLDPKDRPQPMEFAHAFENLL